MTRFYPFKESIPINKLHESNQELNKCAHTSTSSTPTLKIEEKVLISFKLINIPPEYTKEKLDFLISEQVYHFGCQITAPTEAEVILPQIDMGAFLIKTCFSIKNIEILKYPLYHVGEPMLNKVKFDMNTGTVTIKTKKQFINEGKIIYSPIYIDYSN